MKVRLVVEGALPSLNEYIAAMNSNRHVGNSMKQEAQERVAHAVRSQVADGLCWKYPLRVVFRWVEGSRRRDKDNVAFAKKFVLDALQPPSPRNPYGAGLIEGDGWKHIEGFVDEFAVDASRPRVEVLIEEVESE